MTALLRGYHLNDTSITCHSEEYSPKNLMRSFAYAQDDKVSSYLSIQVLTKSSAVTAALSLMISLDPEEFIFFTS